MKISEATTKDIQEIMSITKVAFLQYKDEMHSAYKLAALFETAEEIENDIKNNHVFVARENGVLVGCIRYKSLTDKLAYVYRFSVDPTEQNGGVGTMLLEYVIEECQKNKFSTIALHTNSKYFKLARYYYGKQFYVHSTSSDRGYIRALFIKELDGTQCDLAPAMTL